MGAQKNDFSVSTGPILKYETCFSTCFYVQSAGILFFVTMPSLTPTVEAVNNLVPGFILLSQTACIQMRINTTSFYGKIGTVDTSEFQLEVLYWYLYLYV